MCKWLFQAFYIRIRFYFLNNKNHILRGRGEGMIILDMLRWSMAENQLGTNVLQYMAIVFILPGKHSHFPVTAEHFPPFKHSHTDPQPGPHRPSSHEVSHLKIKKEIVNIKCKLISRVLNCTYLEQIINNSLCPIIFF